MKVNRRDFIHAGCSLFAATILSASQPAARPRSSSGSVGVAQVNLWLPNLFVDFPLIDHFRMADRLWECTNANEDYYELIDANGYPIRMPKGTSPVYWTSMIVPKINDEVWVLDWQGGPISVSLSIPTAGIVARRISSSRNRQEWTFRSSARPDYTTMRVTPQITAIGGSLSNMRFYRKSQETLLNMGESFNPEFLNLYRGIGRIRFMDHFYTNTNPIMKWEHRTTERNCFWQGWNLIPSTYCGACSVSDSDYTGAHGPNGNPTKSSWSHGDLVQTVLGVAWPAPQRIVSFANGVNPNVNMPSHGFTTGDIVYFAGFTSSSLSPTANFANQTEGKFFRITVIDTNNFTVDGMDSTSWGSAAGGQVAKQVTFAAGNLPRKPLLSNALGSVGRVDITNFPKAPFNLYYDADYDGLKISLLGGNPASMGFPLETLISLANQLNVNPWFCIPTCVDVSFVTNMATQVRDNLNTHLVAAFEYSNEVWNIGGGLIPTGYCLQKGKLFNGGTLLGTACYDNFYGQQFYNFMGAVEAVFSGQMQRVKRVIGLFTAGSTTAAGQKQRLQSPSANIGGAYPVSRCDQLALAPYLESRRSNTSNAQYVYMNKINRSDPIAMAWLDGKLRAVDGTNYTLDYCVTNRFPNFAGLAAAPAPKATAVGLTMYEGGWGYIPQLNALTASSFNGVSLLATSITITGTANNGFGAIRLTVSSTSTLVDGQPYWVGGVLGTTEANGYWTMTVVDSTHVDLQDSTFTNAYVANGQVLSDRDNFFFDYYGTALYAQLLTEYLNGFVANGGVHPSQYTMVGNWGANVMWGTIVPTMYGTQTPAYLALRSFNGG